MGYKIAQILKSAQLAQSLSKNGRQTILARHTCAKRAEELERIFEEIQSSLPIDIQD